VQTTLAHYTKTVRTDVRQVLEKRAKNSQPESLGATNGHFAVRSTPPRTVN